MGALEEGERYARAVRYGSGDKFQQLSKRTALADALHQRGKRSEARALFEAKRCIIFSTPCSRYCELAEGEIDDVLRRGQKLIEWRVPGALCSIALEHVSLGRAYLAGGELRTCAWLSMVCVLLVKCNTSH